MPVYGSDYATYLVIFPETMRRGDSWEFSLYSPTYAGPNAEDGPWTATAVFASGTARINQAATVSGDPNTFEWAVLPTTTATFPSGPASYVIQVTNSGGTLRRTLEEGGVTVIDDIADPGTPVDSQSMLQKQLAAADQCLLDLLNQRTERVSFGGKQYELWNIKDLWTVRNAIYARVAAEEEEESGNMRARCIVPVFINW
jgi:hypothetical protein